jgi:hypothetical protein
LILIFIFSNVTLGAVKSRAFFSLDAVFLPCLLGALACSSHDGDSAQGGGEAGPVYVFMTQTYTAEDRTVYLKLTDSLDLDTDLLTVDDAYEFPSVANFEAVGGRLYVSSGEAKTITDHEVSASRELVEGVTLDFSNYPLTDNANFHYQFVIREGKAVMPFDVTSRIVWDLKAMRFLETIEDTAIPFEQDGLEVGSDGNRSATRFDAGSMMVPYFTTDEDDLYGDFSYIATYDDDIRETEVITVPCAGLERVTRAEDGTTYFSSQWNAPILHLYGLASAPCAVRALAGGTLDEGWTTDFTDWTGGHFVMNFRYLRGGKAIGIVVYHEEFGADFDGEFDPALEDLLWEGGYVRPWLFDVENGTAEEIEGFDVPFTPALQTEVVDNRIFLFASNDERTKIYEITDDAVASLKYEMTGDVYKLERLR